MSAMQMQGAWFPRDVTAIPHPHCPSGAGHASCHSTGVKRRSCSVSHSHTGPAHHWDPDQQTQTTGYQKKKPYLFPTSQAPPPSLMPELQAPPLPVPEQEVS